jgi:hypothetical protein
MALAQKAALLIMTAFFSLFVQHMYCGLWYVKSKREKMTRFVFDQKKRSIVRRTLSYPWR